MAPARFLLSPGWSQATFHLFLGILRFKLVFWKRFGGDVSSRGRCKAPVAFFLLEVCIASLFPILAYGGGQGGVISSALALWLGTM